MLAKIAEGIPVEGMESLAPALVDRLVPLTDYLPDGAAVAVLSPERVASPRGQPRRDEPRVPRTPRGAPRPPAPQAPIDLGAGDFLTRQGAARVPRATSAPGGRSAPFEAQPTRGRGSGARRGAARRLRGVPPRRRRSRPGYAGQRRRALEHVGSRLRDGWSVASSPPPAAASSSAPPTCSPSAASPPARSTSCPPSPSRASPTSLTATSSAGFEQPEIAARAASASASSTAAPSAYDTRQVKKLATRRKNVVDPLQLKAGDYVVHQTHGIGRFVELVQREVAGTRARAGGRKAPEKVDARVPACSSTRRRKRGYPGDKLYVPTDQLDLLTRYVGGEAPAAVARWAAATGRPRRAAPARPSATSRSSSSSCTRRGWRAQGHAFGPDTPWQRELEEAFPFAETPDQLQTIDEVKADMERPIPMDRLISGDVGFGKTEIAVRAAFKADPGRQAGRHARADDAARAPAPRDLPGAVRRLPRAPARRSAGSRPTRRRRRRSTGLADGTVDVVIGTHRLLADGIRFKDLGLVIIDEEQRFGVEHKDALKKLKTNVDILAMSATPIPRTLEMAVTGIREMSTLATPPEDRHPILTFVGPYSDKQVAAAIRRELLREGQVFFVHNRVGSRSTRVAARARRAGARRRASRVAHGQMGEHALEQVIVDFWERHVRRARLDDDHRDRPRHRQREHASSSTGPTSTGSASCTSCAGASAAAASARTRTSSTTTNKPLSETAHDRLETIAANNELGGGMQVALKDLEIRGAGNLLGGEQSGHIAGVGFDLYLRMIGEAVATFRGEVAEGQTELRLELPVDAHIPEEYVDSERLRLEAYQKLSDGSSRRPPTTAQIDLVLEELTDRYGEPPDAGART